MKKIDVFTDGGCSGNPGPGGWAFVLISEKKLISTSSGGEKFTTNNKMELTAVIRGLSALKEPCAVDLYTDSKYVLEGATKWLEGWIQKGWKRADKKPVLNVELWQQLLPLLQKHEITWHWVKGHAGHPQNELVDTLACKERDNFANL